MLILYFYSHLEMTSERLKRRDVLSLAPISNLKPY